MTDWPADHVRDCVARECRRPVLWTIDEHDRPRPVDPEPVAGGFVLVEVGPDGNVYSTVETRSDPPGDRWELHHWTCGARDRWRRRQSIRPGELKW